jgi:hypothetical protein
MTALALTLIVLALTAFPAPADPLPPGTGKGAPRAVDGSPKQPATPPLPADSPSPGGSPAGGDQKTDGPALKLPGLTLNAKERCVDIEATICLDDGALELVACIKDSKEHESIIAVEALPIHIHTALLLLGAKNGNPPARRPLNEELTRWADLPPRGDLIDVFLEFKDATGKLTERPISDFIARSAEHAPEPGAGEDPPPRFPHTFIFAGSLLVDNGPGPKEYLADRSGHVISIATFGDELLCLPEVHSQDNGALMWRIDPTHLPKPGTKVTLRLRLKKDPASEPKP